MNMNNMFKELFNPIHANEGLKNQTKAFLTKKTQRYTKTENTKVPLYAASCACLLFILVGVHWLYFTPTAQISIDINPSIEMGVNRFEQVIFVRDFNEDGRELSNMLDIKYKSYDYAVEQILDHDMIAALLSDNEVMTITVIGPDGQQSAKMLSYVEACTAEKSNTYCYFMPPEKAAAAHAAGLSCGKYRAFLELQRFDPNITPAMVQGMTMREIRDFIDSLSIGSGNASSSYDSRENGNHEHGNGHGRGWRNGKTKGQDVGG